MCRNLIQSVLNWRCCSMATLHNLLMWAGFAEAEAWELVSTEYRSHDTEVHVLRMYARAASAISGGRVFAFKLVALAPTCLSTSKSLSLKGKPPHKLHTEITALQRLRGYSCVAELFEVLNDDTAQEFLGSFLQRGGRQGKQERSVCLVLEYCPGKTLKEFLAGRQMDESEIVWLSLQIFECLSVLRECGVLHRDLRSANLMVAGEELKLVDFDCAFIRGVSGAEQLTFAFAETTTAPELAALVQMKEGEKDLMTSEEMFLAQEACDLYSFGALIYEIITSEEYSPQQNSLSKLNAIQVSQQLKDLVRLLLQSLPSRLTHLQTEAYLRLLATQTHVPLPRQRRKMTRESLTVPQLEEPSSLSSQSIEEASLSDWSLSSTHELPARRPQRPSTIAQAVLPRHHATVSDLYMRRLI